MKNNNYNKWYVCFILFGAFCFVSIGLSWYHNRGPWYLGCSDGKGAEYLVKLDKKPRIKGSFIKIGKDTFITPIPGMTCRAVTVREVENNNSNKPIDN